MIRSVGIVSKPGKEEIQPIVRELTAWLKQHGIEWRCDRVTAEYMDCPDSFPREEMPGDFDLVIVLGGDGTLLSVARGVGDRETPLLAVNLGGLGFLMSTGPHEIYEHLERVLTGDYAVQKRTVLSSEVIRNGETIAHFEALNDVVVSKAAMARLLELDAFVEDEFVCSYRADGLIISTPTGSTAYSLSAGGPVIFPSVSAVCITPICPHTLTNRPVLLPASSTVEIVIRAGDDLSYLTIDGQVGLDLNLNDRIRTWPAKHNVQIVQPRRVRFFEVLRSKMKWGEG
jgi:NAD+ kinase